MNIQNRYILSFLFILSTFLFSEECIVLNLNNDGSTGGGSKNKFIIKLIKDLSNVQIIPNKDLDIKVDFVESDAFSYLGVRRLKKLPISFPSTTNVSSAITGGKII